MCAGRHVALQASIQRDRSFRESQQAGKCMLPPPAGPASWALSCRLQFSNQKCFLDVSATKRCVLVSGRLRRCAPTTAQERRGQGKKKEGRSRPRRSNSRRAQGRGLQACTVQTSGAQGRCVPSPCVHVKVRPLLCTGRLPMPEGRPACRLRAVSHPRAPAHLR